MKNYLAYPSNCLIVRNNPKEATLIDCNGETLFRFPSELTDSQIWLFLDFANSAYQMGQKIGRIEKAHEIMAALTCESPEEKSMIKITTPFNTTWPETLHLEGEDEFHPKTSYTYKTINFLETCGNGAAVYQDGDLFVRVETGEDEYLLGGWFKRIETARLTDEELHGGE